MACFARIRHQGARTVSSIALGAGLMLPLDSPAGWEVLTFSRRPAHDVRFSATGLVIDVRRSAGPVVYPLPRPQSISRVRAAGRVSGRLALPPTATQGGPGADDYVLRIGLVEAGDRRLGRWQRLGAAAWVKRLFELAPAGEGLAHVRFLNVAEETSHVGARRVHPLSDLLVEQVVTAVAADGHFAIDHALDRETRVVGIWISSDGDDTASSFRVTLEQLHLD